MLHMLRERETCEYNFINIIMNWAVFRYFVEGIKRIEDDKEKESRIKIKAM